MWRGRGRGQSRLLVVALAFVVGVAAVRAVGSSGVIAAVAVMLIAW